MGFARRQTNKNRVHTTIFMHLKTKLLGSLQLKKHVCSPEGTHTTACIAGLHQNINVVRK